MKNVGMLLVGLFVVGLVAQSASARLPYKKGAEAKWESKIGEIMKTEKCNLCHYGKTKENRNDLGQALMKCGFGEEKYNELKADKEKLAEYVQEVLKKVEAEKSASGVTFGELIKAGKDPSTEPEPAE